MLQVRNFNGKIAEDKEKKIPEIKYQYRRICFPWSRTGKDVEDKEVEGAIPTLSELLAFFASENISTEIVVTKDSEGKESADGVSVVGLLVDGWNTFQNRTSRTKAENTPESARDKAIAMYMRMMSVTRDEAIAALKSM